MDMTIAKDAIDFIDHAKLDRLVGETREDAGRVRDILAKSMSKQALTVEETSVLLATESPELVEEIFESARQLKRDVYGNRIVLFAPLYIGNHCMNDCKYCGFRRSLRTAVRRTLNDQELEREILELEKIGHKRLILVYGEHPNYSPEFIAHTVEIAYKTKIGPGEIRRVNINAAPLDVEGFRTVKASGIGTYQIFQETYHRPTYAQYHPVETRKGNYFWRLNAMDRALQAGCDDVGIGVLFGLYDWRWEVLALVSHAIHLQQEFNVGPHTISFPRIQPAHGLDLALPYRMTDAQFKRMVAILRLAVPYTGLIMTARESAAVRNDVMEFGVSQIDAGTRLEIGAYQEDKSKSQELDREQFKIGDERQLDETIHWLIDQGYIPSFCTSCYRLGRTGEHFMEFAIPGFINRFCTPNALLTLSEYLNDYASPETKAAGEKLVASELAKYQEGKIKPILTERLTMVNQGQHDLYF
ncbi:MAG: [FeFe] hydrogenase H-cluster radical SAM maturase HydG [Planctomycetia bacterium]|nr:[FeFe] hydrogenase H-cluster radical SAM maturase HydG [Planctomycetia bacterium]